MTICDIKRNCLGEVFISLNGNLLEIIPPEWNLVLGKDDKIQCICPANCEHQKSEIKPFIRHRTVSFDENGGEYTGSLIVKCHTIKQIDEKSFQANDVTITIDEKIQFIGE